VSNPFRNFWKNRVFIFRSTYDITNSILISKVAHFRPTGLLAISDIILFEESLPRILGQKYPGVLIAIRAKADRI
jgi:hypothetical protein